MPTMRRDTGSVTGRNGQDSAVIRVRTAVILSVVYALSVGPIGLLTRLFGKDPLDRGLAPEPSFWRAHEPNPLGPERAARHQF